MLLIFSVTIYLNENKLLLLIIYHRKNEVFSVEFHKDLFCGRSYF
jgi:hypothetical protein